MPERIIKALGALSETIEKGRGLLPRGAGAKRSLLRRALNESASHALSAQESKRIRAGVDLKRPRDGIFRSGKEQYYVLTQSIRRQGAKAKRKGKIAGYLASRGVRKALEGLEKALRISGGVRVSPKQRRTLATSNAVNRNYGRGYSATRGPHYGSKHKLSPGAAFLRTRSSEPYGDLGGRARARRAALTVDPKDKRQRQSARRLIAAYLGSKGKASPYKRKVFGRGLKRIKKGAVAKAKPKTLYVYRPVENAEDIIAWAKSQGFATTLEAGDLHVTLAYSKTPMNWAKLHDDWRLEPDEQRVRDASFGCGCGPVMWSDDGQKRRKIAGGVREVKALGDEGAIVLAFESDTLTERWMDFKRAGAVWKFPSFTPHITITYQGKGVDLSKVHPYAGDIVLGEECWEEIKEGAQAAAIEREKGSVAKALSDFDARLAAVEKAAKEQPALPAGAA